MKILFDNIIFSLQKAGGISVYWKELLSRVEEKELEYLEYKNAVNNIFRRNININHNAIIRPKLPMKIARYINPRIKSNQKIIFHSSYYRVNKTRHAINVITVYDFVYEKYCTGLTKLIHHNQKMDAIKKCDAIICISESTKRDLLNYIPGAESKVSVIYIGVSEEFGRINEEVKKNSKIELLGNNIKPFILFVGQRNGYKNFSLVKKALEHLKDYTLVTVGGEPYSETEKTKMVKTLNGRFIPLQNVNNDQLNNLYNSAFCLVYPSLYEGFGIPVIEAMRAGCPVITTNRASLPEVGGDAALYMANESASIIEKTKIIENRNYRLKIIDQGYKHSMKFTWERTVQETMRLYNNLL